MNAAIVERRGHPQGGSDAEVRWSYHRNFEIGGKHGCDGTFPGLLEERVEIAEVVGASVDGHRDFRGSHVSFEIPQHREIADRVTVVAA
ncbi:hypothetical protein [Ensifer sp. KUDG1]|uniref:hypothetical protein n=1 Tax=Ensifer sp. KUDG1 TaxID=3373919 RepID=UPI003D1E532A